MKKIELKEIKVGDYIYIVENIFIQKDRNRRFILEVLSKKRGLKYDTNFWSLESVSKKTSIFDPTKHKGNYIMSKEDWGEYRICYKLNKEEISKFIKLHILENL